MSLRVFEKESPTFEEIASGFAFATTSYKKYGGSFQPIKK
jgi:hypothetical protein